MFWNERTRQWEKHPLCDCGEPSGMCICLNLPMLDAHGEPIGEHGVLGPDIGRNKDENAAEAAHERMVENYYGSSSPQTVQEQVDAAWQQRMEWRRR